MRFFRFTKLLTFSGTIDFITEVSTVIVTITGPMAWDTSATGTSELIIKAGLDTANLITPVPTVIIWKEASTARWWKLVHGETFPYEILNISFWYWELSFVIKKKGIINQWSTFPMSSGRILFIFILFISDWIPTTKLRGKNPWLWILKLNFYFTQKWLTTD